MTVIRKIDLYQTELELAEPYHLSFGTVSTLITVFARTELADGRIGWGESTPLPGYDPVTAEQAWETGQTLAAYWVGMPAEAALHTGYARPGFATTALVTALEWASGEFVEGLCDVPAAGLIQGCTEQLREHLATVRHKGYRTFKLKVGAKTLEEDIARTEAAQDALRDGETLRVDANGAWSADQAILFAARLDPERTQLFEQPVPANAWNDLAKVAARSSVPIMPDEAIRDLRDIRRAASIPNVGFIKLKWMKQGSWRALADATELAKNLGLRVILGNGVATGLNNYQECLFWERLLRGQDLATEANGFAKLPQDPLKGRLVLEHGCIRAAAAIPPADILVDLQSVCRHRRWSTDGGSLRHRGQDKNIR